MSALFPAYVLRETDNAGRPLSGGLIWTYKSGTQIPKPVFTDAALTIPWSNPVVLDVSGSADIFMGDGAYGIQVQDHTGANVRPRIDGITASSGSGGSAGSNATSAYVKTYNDLRALPDIPDTVYVAGNTAEGDGGAGQFQLVPGSSIPDDGGIVLTSGAGSNVYKRIFDGVINPEWYGVKYGISTNQYTAFNLATAASARWNSPLYLTAGVYLTQNTVVPAGASIHASVDGYFYSGAAITVTFADDSKFSSESTAFSDSVSPKFGLRVVPTVNLSWMAGTSADDRLTKFLASPSASNTKQALFVDVPLTTSLTTITYAGTIKFDPTCALTFATGTGILSISLPGIVDSNSIMFSFPAGAVISLLAFGATRARPEWFGAVAIGNDDSKPLYYAFKSGRATLGAGNTYKLTTAIPSLSTVDIDGAGTLYFGTGLALGMSNLTIRDLTVTQQTPGNWLTTMVLMAYQANFPSTYTATAVEVDGCSYTDKPFGYVPVYDGKPQIYNAHLPLILDAESLGTDSVGKVVGYNIREFEAPWNIAKFSTTGHTLSFTETPALMISTDGTTGFWYRSASELDGVWVLQSTTNIPYYSASNQVLEYMACDGTRLYAAVHSGTTNDFKAQIFYTTNLAGTSGWTLISGYQTPVTQYYQGWSGCLRSNNTFYFVHGRNNQYVNAHIVKVVGTTAVEIPTGTSAPYMHTLDIDTGSGYAYFNAFTYNNSTNWLIRVNISTDVVHTAVMGVYPAMATLGNGNRAIFSTNAGDVGLLDGLTTSPSSFAPTSALLPANPAMGAIKTMVKCGYSLAAGNNNGYIGVAPSTNNARYFSRRLSGMDGVSFNGQVPYLGASYHSFATGETFIGGSGSSIFSRMA